MIPHPFAFEEGLERIGIKPWEGLVLIKDGNYLPELGRDSFSLLAPDCLGHSLRLVRVLARKFRVPSLYKFGLVRLNMEIYFRMFFDWDGAIVTEFDHLELVDIDRIWKG